MKTTIYELLGMIKDGKTPKEIMYDSKLWEYDNQSGDYFTNHYDGTEWLFDGYVITDILNNEVEILDEPKEDKIEKIDTNKYYITECNKIAIEEIMDKINEIIDYINKEMK